MYGLYDINGMLRFTGADLEACIDYADLLGISAEEYSLMNLQDSNQDYAEASSGNEQQLNPSLQIFP